MRQDVLRPKYIFTDIVFLKSTLIQCLLLYEVFSLNFEWRHRVDLGRSYGNIGKHFIIRIYNILSSG